jgi:hypothetical protein
VTFAKSVGKSVAPYLSGSERLLGAVTAQNAGDAETARGQPAEDLVRALHVTRVGG